MSRKKRKLESFDVSDFLRESDDDLKSALNSLLRSPMPDQTPQEARVVLPRPVLHPEKRPGLVVAADGEEFPQTTGVLSPEVLVNAAPSIITVPGLKLREPELIPRPGQASSDSPLMLDLNLRPGIGHTEERQLIAQDTANAPEYDGLSETDTNSIPGLNLIHFPPADEPDSSEPGLKLTSPPYPSPGRKQRQFPIREMRLAQDAHTRAEQQVYEALWENAKVYDEVSKVITIGFGAMARMVRLSESNARINVRNLIAKLAIEEMGSYNCEYAIGRSYRILNYTEIQRRRREAGLTWYMRRTLAVIFVDPETKEPIDLGSKKRIQQGSANLRPGLNLRPGPGPKLGPPPGLNLRPLTIFSKEEFREELLRESSASALYQALSIYGTVDDDALARLRSAVEEICPDCTEAEIIHFVHAKGEQLRRPDSRVSNPIGFLLTAVPKCFAGESFLTFRAQEWERRRQEDEERERQKRELEVWKRSQQAILDDHTSTEEAKYWARKLLFPEEGTDSSGSR